MQGSRRRQAASRSTLASPPGNGIGLGFSGASVGGNYVADPLLYSEGESGGSNGAALRRSPEAAGLLVVVVGQVVLSVCGLGFYRRKPRPPRRYGAGGAGAIQSQRPTSIVPAAVISAGRSAFVALPPRPILLRATTVPRPWMFSPMIVTP